MFKAMILLKRKEEYSQREFRNWWLGEHAQPVSYTHLTLPTILLV